MDAAINAQYFGLDDCVISGCELFPQGGGGFNIGAGLVWLEGGVYRYDGQASLTLPVELYLAAEVLTDLRPYQTGGSDYCMSERKALTRAVGGAGSAILVTADGIIGFNKAREKSFRSVAEMVPVLDFAAEWDQTGAGIYGTKSYGWQLMNGQGGTVSMDGRFPIGYGPSYPATRAIGGVADVQLTADQNGPHSHQMDQAGAHTHTYSDRYSLERNAIDAGSDRRWDQDTTSTKTTSSAGSHTHTVQDSGLGAAHTNIPPYAVVAWKMWVGF
ncbi:MAG: hypothetical protein V4621_08080 [Pseudomonadota bacterium]